MSGLAEFFDFIRTVGVTAILILVVIVLIILPPSMDPAIRWKERNEKRLKRWKDYDDRRK